MPIESVSCHMDCRFIKISPVHDERGYLYESFNDQIQDIVKFSPKQEIISKSSRSVVRGLHMQNRPLVSKMVRVLQGEINDVVVDCRPESPDFGKHFMISLTSDNFGWFFIPGGYAHGFEVVSDFAIVNYFFSEKYNPKLESTIFAYDPDLNIKWETSKEKSIMSPKDKFSKNLRDLIK